MPPRKVARNQGSRFRALPLAARRDATATPGNNTAGWFQSAAFGGARSGPDKEWQFVEMLFQSAALAAWVLALTRSYCLLCVGFRALPLAARGDALSPWQALVKAGDFWHISTDEIRNGSLVMKIR